MAIFYDTPENFKSEDEFIDCFNRGCEAQFDYDGKSYSVGFAQERRFGICEAYHEENETCYDTAEALLDHPIGNKRLRDILRDMEVTERTVY